jgi:hypothetical protein
LKFLAHHFGAFLGIGDRRTIADGGVVFHHEFIAGQRNQGTGGYGFFGDKSNGLGVFDIDQGVDHLQGRIDPAAKGIHFNHDDGVRGIGYVIQGSFQKRRHARLDIA